MIYFPSRGIYFDDAALTVFGLNVTETIAQCFRVISPPIDQHNVMPKHCVIVTTDASYNNRRGSNDVCSCYRNLNLTVADTKQINKGRFFLVNFITLFLATAISRARVHHKSSPRLSFFRRLGHPVHVYPSNTATPVVSNSRTTPERKAELDDGIGRFSGIMNE